MINFHINGVRQTVDVDTQTPILWVVREQLKLTGTKFGCGASLCGACTVHLDGEAVRACVTPIAAAQGKHITTIEGLAPKANPDESPQRHALQQAWIEHQVPQCGYCQSGQIMTAAALLATIPDPSDADIDAAMSGNVCRCGMYGRIKDAIKTAAKTNAATVKTPETLAGDQ